MRRVESRVCALILLVAPLACTAQDDASKAVEDGHEVLAQSFADLVFGFCSAIVSQKGEPNLERVSPTVTFRGPIPLSKSGPLSGPLQHRLQATPDTLVYAATTEAAGVGRFQVAYALADGSACVALAQDMPDVVSKISARIEADRQYKLQSRDEVRRIYVGSAARGEQSITISMPATLIGSGMADVQVRRAR